MCICILDSLVCQTLLASKCWNSLRERQRPASVMRRCDAIDEWLRIQKYMDLVLVFYLYDLLDSMHIMHSNCSHLVLYV